MLSQNVVHYTRKCPLGHSLHILSIAYHSSPKMGLYLRSIFRDAFCLSKLYWEFIPFHVSTVKK